MKHQLYHLTNFEENSLPVLQKIFDDVYESIEDTIYTDVVPTADKVPTGKKVIYDNGSGTKRIYWKTGKGNLGYVSLT